MLLIDTHSHVYSTEFENDQPDMLKRALDAGVGTILMPAIDRSTHGLMLDTERDNPGHCLSMMGLHPCSVKENFQDELDVIGEFLQQRGFHGIGETGLDFYWDLSFKEQQYIAFKRQASWALQYKKPLVIHSRSSTDECIEVVREMQDGNLEGVFHCFSGTVEQARKVMEQGFYLGIGGVLTFKNSGLDKVVKEIGLDKLVLETDAPYLAPTPFRGKRNEPAYLVQVARKLADIFERPVEEIAEITTANAKKLFQLD
ncbi:MAG: TatD family deoxyribonuclease [Chitinophagaceae bacterium]|nr:MAG: TatD family deoxyribonuclease [Chitinophagaceae bacterium]